MYAGTSEGIYIMDGSAFFKLDDRKRYNKLDLKGALQIDSNGIKYHDQQSFTHLLPFPDIKKQEFHTGTDDFFYITTGGKMYVYEFLPLFGKIPEHQCEDYLPEFHRHLFRALLSGTKARQTLCFPHRRTYPGV